MWWPLLKTLRPTQWSKNLFVLAPLVFGGLLFNPDAVARGLLALAVFCAAASTVYLFNDLRDREADREHPLKRHRPLAAGTLSPSVAVAAALVLAAATIAGSLWLGATFTSIIAVYLILNTGYSLGLKHVVILDVLIVSLGFVLRVLAGAAAVDVVVSRWLTLCTIFVALFLVLSKRRHEVVLLADDASRQREVLEHYSAPFLDQMINVVTASTVVCYALYAVAPETVDKYESDYLVYTLPMVLFGIFRYLFLIYQSTHHRNPTETMLGDVPFLVNLAVWGLAVTWIIYGL
ncbi:MAG: decaprenyl-phosphate phosphoribosyltransferase [Acidobacteria bacterium]|nr:decaprenyl-phosphate phosphoribosyltransferase [Acidobacteriota bacterium]